MLMRSSSACALYPIPSTMSDSDAAQHPSRRGFLSTVGSAIGGAAAVGALPAPLSAMSALALNSAAPARGLAAAGDFMLEPGLHYLQTGSMGPTPRPVMQRTIAYWQELERNPTKYGYGDHEKGLEVVRSKAAALIGCTTAEIVLTTSTSDGMNRVAQGLSLNAGDHVLTTDQEHPGGRACWDYLVRTRGVVLDVVPIVPGEHDASAIVARMARAITPQTRVISFSHILSSTGLRMPVIEFCALARAHDCVSIVDGAQAVGGIAVNVKTLGCDVYATSGHKWLLAPKGTGLLYLRDGLGTRVDPIQLQSGREAYTASTGVCNLPGVLGLGAAIEYHMTRTSATIEAYNLSLRARLDVALQTVPNIEIVSAREPGLTSPLLSYRLPDAIKAGDLRERLDVRHRVYVKIVPGNWFNGQRISTHLFNTEGDVDALVRALRVELARG